MISQSIVGCMELFAIMATLLQYAIEVNTDGVDCLQTQREEKAIQYYTYGLTTFMARLGDEWSTLVERSLQIQPQNWMNLVPVRAAAAVLQQQQQQQQQQQPAVVTPCQSRCSSPHPHDIKKEDEVRCRNEVLALQQPLPPVIDAAYLREQQFAVMVHIYDMMLTNYLQQHRAFVIHSVPTDDYMCAIPLPRKLDQNVFTLYNRAFELKTFESDILLEPWLHCVDAIFIVFSFNTALARHVLAVRMDGSKEAFRQALSGYLGTYARIQRLVVTNNYKQEYDILFMALLNNLGHCHAILGETEAAMGHLDALDFMIQHSTQRHRLVDDEVCFFEARLTLGRMVQPATRPASAA